MIYRQVSRKLRWSLGPGLGERVSERPRDKKTGAFLDADTPTLVEIGDADIAAGVDVDALLRIGAIEMLPAEDGRSARNVAGEGGGGGEAGE